MIKPYTETAAWLKQRLPEVPKVAMILGTGLNAIAERGETMMEIPYGDIPGFASSTAPSHKGNLVLSELDGQKVLFLQGRFHFYEGHPMSAVVFPTRVLACLGVKTLIVTNASGSLKEELGPGSIVMLEDHINHMGTNPLIGENDEGLGERFPSMNHPYDPVYRERCFAIAHEQNIPLHSGVYLAVTGPSLETRAECAAFAGWGADLVGMSTVPEVIVARYAGMKVLAFSVVTNHSNLFHDKAHSQEEIRANADRASAHLINLITRFLKSLD